MGIRRHWWELLRNRGNRPLFTRSSFFLPQTVSTPITGVRQTPLSSFCDPQLRVRPGWKVIRAAAIKLRSLISWRGSQMRFVNALFNILQCHWHGKEMYLISPLLHQSLWFGHVFFPPFTSFLPCFLAYRLLISGVTSVFVFGHHATSVPSYKTGNNTETTAERMWNKMLKGLPHTTNIPFSKCYNRDLVM